MVISKQQFEALFPDAPDEAFDPLVRSMVRYDITSIARASAYLAQIGHESAGLTRFEENLNYSAARLAAVWPSRYKAFNGGPNALATQIARNPQAIANNTYANRMGNGDVLSGDGWRYRGRGPLQVTGKEGYRKAQVMTGRPFLENPDLMATYDGGLEAAAATWRDKGCNTLADQGRFSEITRRINGGMNGAEDRELRWQKAKKVLSQ